jgi:hypothetical protein
MPSIIENDMASWIKAMKTACCCRIRCDVVASRRSVVLTTTLPLQPYNTCLPKVLTSSSTNRHVPISTMPKLSDSKMFIAMRKPSVVFQKGKYYVSVRKRQRQDNRDNFRGHGSIPDPGAGGLMICLRD